MSIGVEPGPPSGRAIVAAKLRGHRRPEERKALVAAGIAAVAVAPMPLYAISPLRLASEQVPAAAVRRYGWRYLVLEGNEGFLVDLVRRTDGSLAAFSVAGGTAAARLSFVALTAERELEGKGDFEARILDLSLLGIEGLWMWNAEGGLVYSLNEDGPPQPFEKLLSVARARASRMLEAAASSSSEDGA